MHGGKAGCAIIFGKPSISVFPIFSSDNFFIFSAIFIIIDGSWGSSFTLSLFSICLLTSSLRSLAVSVFVR